VPAQLEDNTGAYRWLLEQGVTADRIVLAGDSAGASLAIGTALKLRQDALAGPAGIVAVSPWIDLECKGESMSTNAEYDVLLSRDLLLQMAAIQLGPDGSAIDPLANPLHADPTGLPPIHVVAGGDEAVLSDATRFADTAREAGVEITVTVAEGMQHCFPMMAGRAAEADQAVAEIAAFVRTWLDLS
jgi:acetyl esterase/lipase